MLANLQSAFQSMLKSHSLCCRDMAIISVMIYVLLRKASITDK